MQLMSLNVCAHDQIYIFFFYIIVCKSKEFFFVVLIALSPCPKLGVFHMFVSRKRAMGVD